MPVVALASGCGGGGDLPEPAADERLQPLVRGPRGTPFDAVGKGGLLVQTPYAAFGDFELLLPTTDGHLLTLRRRNSVAGLPWEMAWAQGLSSRGTLQGAAHCFSTNHRNVEAVVVDGGRLRTVYRSAQSHWYPVSVAPPTDLQGQPALVQARFGGALQLHAVVGATGGGLVHLVRDENGFGWSVAHRFGSGRVRAVSMIQGNYVDGAGNRHLELIAWVDDDVRSWFYAGGAWSPNGTVVAGEAAGAPALIQGNRGQRGNFEALVPLAGGGLAHCWRANDTDLAWRRHARIGQGVYRAAGLLQAQFGTNGNLEAVGVRGDEVDVFWNDDAAVWRQSVTVRPLLPASAGAVQPAATGRSARVFDIGLSGIHAVLLHDGRVLMFDLAGRDGAPAGTLAVVWNPVDDRVVPVTDFRYSFCSGHLTLPDGRVLIVGGHLGDTLRDVVLVDPVRHIATRVAELPTGRWYPTLAPLPDGSAFIVGGTRTAGWNDNVESTWQTYHPRTGLSAPLAVPQPFSPHFPDSQKAIDLYPHACILPGGDLLVHARNTTRFLHLPTRTWRSTVLRNVSADSRTYPFAGAFALLPLRPSEGYRVRLLVSGGASSTASVPIGQKGRHATTEPALASAELLDLGASPAAWRSVAPMRHARFMHDLVTLPDGTVFCVGGNAMGHADVGTGPVLIPELYDPASNTWTELAACRVARGYHASALLLPDGRVAIFGKDGQFQGEGLKHRETRVELYEPPCLFRGARPVIAQAPSSLAFGAAFDVDLAVGTPASSVSRVVLVACGSATHSINFQQRVVELALTRVGDRRLRLVAPPDGTVAPPGGYMLFAIGAQGAPGVARMVTLRGADTLAVARVDEAVRRTHAQGVSLDDAGPAPRCVTPTVATGGWPERPA